VFDAIEADDTWGCRDLGCGHLLLALRKRLSAMPGGIIHLISHDPGSPEDLPAWCRITHNTRLRHDPDAHAYWIRARNSW
jgi:tRNA 2-thiouridine synthesizing protein A